MGILREGVNGNSGASVYPKEGMPGNSKVTSRRFPEETWERNFEGPFGEVWILEKDTEEIPKRGF